MTKTEIPIAQFLTPQEVADRLQVTAQTVINMCRRNELDHVSWGSAKRTTFRIHPEAIEKLRRGQQEADATEPKIPDQVNDEADASIGR